MFQVIIVGLILYAAWSVSPWLLLALIILG